MRQKFFIILVAFALTVGTAGISSASYSFDMGPGSSVDTSGTDNVLQMEATVNPNLDNVTFPLNEGQSNSFFFATVSTNESWINEDDVNPGSVTAYVDFDNPDLVQAIGGTSVGFSASWQLWGHELPDFKQGWNLTWDDPVVVNFGNGGQFTIELEDVAYSSLWWQGPDGSLCGPGYADVNATVTLNKSPVPLPGSLLFLASGLIGLIGLREGRKRAEI